MSIVRFNIRVYILLLDESKTRVLLSDEIIGGKYFTKFPGGGLEGSVKLTNVGKLWARS
jgi:hypothetical protein